MAPELPTELSQFAARRPEGLTSPNNRSATAFPPSLPQFQATNNACTPSSSEFGVDPNFDCPPEPKVAGRHDISTTTTGVSVRLVTACSKSSCDPGKSRSSRSRASPQVLVSSPSTSTTTSDALAAATASSIILGDGGLCQSAPTEYATSSPTTFRMPCSTVTTFD